MVFLKKKPKYFLKKSAKLVSRVKKDFYKIYASALSSAKNYIVIPLSAPPGRRPVLKAPAQLFAH